MIQLLIGTNFPFMKYRRGAYLFSGAVLLATLVWLLIHGGPRLSVDFSGGTLLQIRTSQSLPADQLRALCDRFGLKLAALTRGACGAVLVGCSRRGAKPGDRASSTAGTIRAAKRLPPG